MKHISVHHIVYLTRARCPLPSCQPATADLSDACWRLMGFTLYPAWTEITVWTALPFSRNQQVAHHCWASDRVFPRRIWRKAYRTWFWEPMQDNSKFIMSGYGYRGSTRKLHLLGDDILASPTDVVNCITKNVCGHKTTYQNPLTAEISCPQPFSMHMHYEKVQSTRKTLNVC